MTEREKLLAALETCLNQDCYSYNSVECPLHDEDNCIGKLKGMALEVLRKDEEEIRKLRQENEALHRENFWLTHGQVAINYQRSVNLYRGTEEESEGGT